MLAIENTTEIQQTYLAKEIIDTKGKTIVPGLIDAHCHFYGLNLNKQTVNFVDTTSFDDVIKRVIDFQNKKTQTLLLVEVGIKTIGKIKPVQPKRF